jgi:hypothetical protein
VANRATCFPTILLPAIFIHRAETSSEHKSDGMIGQLVARKPGRFAHEWRAAHSFFEVNSNSIHAKMHYVAHIPYQPRTRLGPGSSNEKHWFGVSNPALDGVFGTFSRTRRRREKHDHPQSLFLKWQERREWPGHPARRRAEPVIGPRCARTRWGFCPAMTKTRRLAIIGALCYSASSTRAFGRVFGPVAQPDRATVS